MRKTLLITLLMLSTAAAYSQAGNEAPTAANTPWVIYFDESMPLDSVYALQNRFESCLSPISAPLIAVTIFEKEEWKQHFIYSNGPRHPWAVLTEEGIQMILKECNEK